MASDSTATDQAEVFDVHNFRVLAEVLPDTVWTADPNGELDYVSSRWAEVCGLEQDSPDFLNWVSRVHPDDRDQALKVWARHLESGEIYEQEFRVIHANGHVFWCSARATPVLDKDGAVVKWYGITTEVQKLKEAEEAERKASQEKDNFMAVLGHELRNPLAAISTGSELLQSDGLSTTDSKEALNVINREVEHLKRLVDDILDVSRFSTGKFRIDKEKVNLTDVVQHGREQAESIAMIKGTPLEVHEAGEDVWVEGDAVRLTQCVSNLINNAIKFTPGNKPITVRYGRKDDQAFVSVQDQGVGMDEGEVSKLFEPFHQVESATEYTREGLGLGLSIAKNLIQLHGGKISATSEGKGKGATFTFFLPVEQVEQTPVVDYKGERPETGELRVLVIEDNASIAKMLTMFLEMEGHTVEVAGDGRSGVKAFDEFCPQIVFCDISMPGDWDGWDVARQIRPRTEALLVAMSGHSAEAHRAKSKEVGFDKHLAKPPSLDALRDCLALVSSKSL